MEYLSSYDCFKIQTERGFPGCHDAILVTKIAIFRSAHVRMTSSRDSCIANEGNLSKESRQQIWNIWNPSEICLKWSHRGKITLYLDRIY